MHRSSRLRSVSARGAVGLGLLEVRFSSSLSFQLVLERVRLSAAASQIVVDRIFERPRPSLEHVLERLVGRRRWPWTRERRASHRPRYSGRRSRPTTHYKPSQNDVVEVNMTTNETSCMSTSTYMKRCRESTRITKGGLHRNYATLAPFSVGSFLIALPLLSSASRSS